MGATQTVAAGSHVTHGPFVHAGVHAPVEELVEKVVDVVDGVEEVVMDVMDEELLEEDELDEVVDCWVGLVVVWFVSDEVSPLFELEVVTGFVSVEMVLVLLDSATEGQVDSATQSPSPGPPPGTTGQQMSAAGQQFRPVTHATP
jgi:hypothetical protein